MPACRSLPSLGLRRRRVAPPLSLNHPRVVMRQVVTHWEIVRRRRAGALLIQRMARGMIARRLAAKLRWERDEAARIAAEELALFNRMLFVSATRLQVLLPPSPTSPHIAPRRSRLAALRVTTPVLKHHLAPSVSLGVAGGVASSASAGASCVSTTRRCIAHR